MDEHSTKQPLQWIVSPLEGFRIDIPVSNIPKVCDDNNCLCNSVKLTTS